MARRGRTQRLLRRAQHSAGRRRAGIARPRAPARGAGVCSTARTTPGHGQPCRQRRIQQELAATRVGVLVVVKAVESPSAHPTGCRRRSTPASCVVPSRAIGAAVWCRLAFARKTAAVSGGRLVLLGAALHRTSPVSGRKKRQTPGATPSATLEPVPENKPGWRRERTPGGSACTLP